MGATQGTTRKAAGGWLPQPAPACAREVAQKRAARPPPAAAEPSLWAAKQRLLQSIEGTQRGGEASQAVRGDVEEAQVRGLPACTEGRWRQLLAPQSLMSRSLPAATMP